MFRIVIKVPEFGERPKTVAPDSQSGTQATPQVTPQATPQVTPQVKKLLHVLKNEMDRQQILQALGLKARKNLRITYLEPALNLGLIEMTQPESPNSPTQKYRLTAEGRTFVASL